MMLKVGITGNIGSGKSKIASILKEKGFLVFDADSEAKKCMLEEPVKSQLVEIFGKEVYLTDGQLNRTFLASKIFSDEKLLQQVNGIVHPAVRNKFHQWALERKQSIVFKEAAILLESGGKNDVDFVVVVDCPKEIRLQRVMKRDNATPEQVFKRMEKQWSDEEKRKHADFIVLNDGLEALEPQIEKLISILQNKV